MRSRIDGSAMDETRRAVILAEIDQWRAEGLLEDDEYVFMRARYDQGRDPTLDAPIPPRATPSATTSASGYAAHLVGGLVLGAALVALVQFFVPAGPWQPLAAIGASLLSILAAWAAERRRGALAAEAGIAAALVAAGSVPFYALTLPLAGLLAAGVAVGATLLRRGTSPLGIFAVALFFVGMQHATRVDLLAPRPGASEAVFFLSLLAFGALLTRHRRARWGGHAMALLCVGIVLATFPLLDSLGVTDAGIGALGVGLALGALFALSLWLDARAAVAATSVMLAFAAVSFAFLALGPALAAMVLLLLGALLVWQAEVVKGYFGARTA